MGGKRRHGACLTALGWADAVIVMTAMAAGWGVDRLGYVVAPESVPLWGEFGLFALWTAVALGVFVGVTRLPWPRG